MSRIGYANTRAGIDSGAFPLPQSVIRHNDGDKIMSAQWINTIGLVGDIIGVSLLSWGLFTSKEKALQLGLARYTSDTDEKNLKLPAVADRLKQSRFAKFGLPILVAGFLCQIAATWVR